MRLDPAHLKRIIGQLDQDIDNLTVKIGQQQKQWDALHKKLSTTPKRPKIRSQAARIAASGSRAINEKARQFDRQSLWTSWKPVRDRKTAEKYGGVDGAVPPKAETIMRHTLEKNLKKRKALSRPQ
jgi:uncharacterized protein YhaN